MIDDKCPHCGADLKGDEIPEQHRESFGGYTHFSRRISIYDMDKDRTTHYQCPDCKRMWGRNY